MAYRIHAKLVVSHNHQGGDLVRDPVLYHDWLVDIQWLVELQRIHHQRTPCMYEGMNFEYAEWQSHDFAG